MKTYEKTSFLNNLGLLFSARKKVFNIFKSILFPIKNIDNIPTREPTPEPIREPEIGKEPAIEPEVATEPTTAAKATKVKTKRRISSLKLRENFFNEIKNEEKM